MIQKIKDIEIRLLTTSAELEQARKLESAVWGEAESVPVHQTLTVTKNGGFVLGAFLGEKLVGFQYSFPGYDGHSIYLCSHILAVDSKFRSYGVGEKLKQAQWEQSRKMGYSFISWTYDPLESGNGYLNIGKLGAVCSTYIENCYGEMNDYLNSGLPSDRFLVKWMTSEKKHKPYQEMTIQQVMDANIVRWRLNKDGIPVIEEVFSLQPDHESFLAVAIPASFQQIKESAPSIALDWRMKTRKLFTRYFNEGWEVSDFIKNPSAESPVHFYIMNRKEVTN
jgi:predicted GNAT superfamily acetyltransferase